MPNGRPGDHPLTDMLVHGRHPFPTDIEALLREVLALDPRFPDGQRPYREQQEWESGFFAWEQGRDLEAGREALRIILQALRRS